ncbi:helix-turn-helix domain-containing protein [Lacticaseibacillus baoqingensis]|uniref:Helix-turn-helix domain-containing protein n=1 Tax=Lacticaseibacillus baoqingensis TaxID=2486013 RepID=A0ABW4EBZ2_9LACO|nr:helix-turn-helix domain-containing protein [Lacticaseibacillus baoqingensis]
MQLDALLDNVEQRKLALIQDLEDAPELTVNDAEEKASLDLSDYLFNKTVDELITDLHRLHLDDVMRVQHADGQVRLDEDGQATCELLLRAYLQESVSFMLIDALVQGQLTSLAEFADTHYFGYWVVKNRFRAVRKFLSEYRLGIDNAFALTGEAKQKRLVLTALYVFVCQTQSDLLTPDESKAVAELVKDLNTRSGVAITAYQTMVITHYAGVAKLVPQACVDQTLTPLLAPLTPLCTQLQAALRTLVAGDAAGLVQELVVYLLANQAVVPKPGLDTAAIMQYCGPLPDFATIVQTQLELSGQSHEQLAQRYAQVVLAATVFPLDAFLTRQRVDMGFFEGSYPEYFHLVQAFIARQQTVRNCLWQYRISMFYRLFFVLVDTLQLTDLIEPVRICIDFTLGTEYDRYLQRNLQFFTTLNLEFEPVMTADVDILLTDIPELVDSPVETVVWLQPPRPIDWENLARLLVDLRDEKRAAKHTSIKPL